MYKKFKMQVIQRNVNRNIIGGGGPDNNCNNWYHQRDKTSHYYLLQLFHAHLNICYHSLDYYEIDDLGIISRDIFAEDISKGQGIRNQKFRNVRRPFIVIEKYVI